MNTFEIQMLLGICLRLIHGLAPNRPEAMILARWIAQRPETFGAVPSLIVVGPRAPEIHAPSWQFLASDISERIYANSAPLDTAMARLEAIVAHLKISYAQGMILKFLAVQQRQGPIAEFAVLLQREIGLSAEAVIACCCNLDEMEVWTALAPQGRLVALGLVQTDSTLPVMRDDPYTLSGLLRALILPPPPPGSVLELQ